MTGDTLYSGRPNGVRELGFESTAIGRNKGGEAAFTRALSMDRRNSVALLEMGFLRLEAGDTGEAARYHSDYRATAPDAIAKRSAARA